MASVTSRQETRSEFVAAGARPAKYEWCLNQKERYEAMGSGIIEDLNAESFETNVLGAEGSVVVDFWAPWCGPCKMVGPVLEKLAADHDGTVKVVKVNVDENQDLAARYGIMSIPTVMLFEGGAVKQQLIGARSQKDYEREFGIV